MIRSIQYAPMYNEAGFLNESGSWVPIVLDEGLKADLDNVVAKMETMQTQEEKQLDELKERAADLQGKADEAERKARKAEEDLKKAQNQMAELLVGTKGAVMTDEMAQQYPELHDGISIDAGDYYREEGKKVLYRAKKDMVYDSKTMSPTGEHGSEYWTGNGVTEEIPSTSEYKYPKGTEKEYLGAMYYACVDTNDEPSVGYPTWDLLENKPKE